MYNAIPIDLVPETVWAKVDKTDHCWEWVGAKRRHGYGYLCIRKKQYLAHRVIYALLVADDPSLPLDHLCRNTSCVNPDHLERVTLQENSARGFGAAAVNARKTHCLRGHDLAEHGFVVPKGRQCRVCVRESSRISAQKRRARKRAQDAQAVAFRDSVIERDRRSA